MSTNDDRSSGLSRREFLKISSIAASVPLVARPTVIEVEGQEVAVRGPGPVPIMLTVNGKRLSAERSEERRVGKEERDGGTTESRRRHTRCLSDWSSDVCSSDLTNDDRSSGLSRREFLKISSIAASVPLVARPTVIEVEGQEVAVRGPGPVPIMLTVNGKRLSAE